MIIFTSKLMLNCLSLSNFVKGLLTITLTLLSFTEVLLFPCEKFECEEGSIKTSIETFLSPAISDFLLRHLWQWGLIEFIPFSNVFLNAENNTAETQKNHTPLIRNTRTLKKILVVLLPDKVQRPK